MSVHCSDMSLETPPQSEQGHERRATERALMAWTDARLDNELPDLAGLTGEFELVDETEIFTENQFLIMIETYTSNTVVIYYGNQLPNKLERRNY